MGVLREKCWPKCANFTGKQGEYLKINMPRRMKRDFYKIYIYFLQWLAISDKRPRFILVKNVFRIVHSRMCNGRFGGEMFTKMGKFYTKTRRKLKKNMPRRIFFQEWFPFRVTEFPVERAFTIGWWCYITPVSSISCPPMQSVCLPFIRFINIFIF
jgi:hypothetical protein